MQKPIEVFIEQLRNNNLRSTANRLSIFEIMSTKKQPMTIQAITRSNSMKSHFASVYRSINSMVAVGIVREIPHGFKTYYELGEKFQPHHHHLTCDNCHISISIDDARVESLVRDLAITSRFKLKNHQFEIFGLCQNCQRNQILDFTQ